MNFPLAVIEISTYNHEKYIAQAIESVIEQKTDFDFRLIICEDCSTDNTAKICTTYKSKYPDKIDLHLNQKNAGVFPNAKKLHELSFNSSAKYIAMLDGDDYWTDSNKLQRQVGFLEANPDYAICFHRVYELMDNKKLKISDLNISKDDKTYTIEDLAKRNFIHTPSVVFRKGFIKELPEWFLKLNAGDYLIHMLNAKHGKIKYFSDLMATYRRHSSGYWTTMQDLERRKKWVLDLELLMKENFEPSVLSSLKKQVFDTMETGFYNLLLDGQFEKFSEEFKKYISEYPEQKDTWLFETYPRLFKQVTESRTFKTAKKLAAFSKKIKAFS